VIRSSVDAHDRRQAVNALFDVVEDVWPVLVAGVIATLLYHYLPKARSTIIFGGTALGIFLTFGGLIQTASQNSSLAKQERLRVAFTFSERLNTRDASAQFERAALALEAVRGKTPSQTDSMFVNEAISEPLKWVFNNFEDIAQAVRLNYADEQSACALFKDIGLKYFSGLEPWLRYRRAQSGNHAMHEPYEWLYNRWANGCPHGGA
jgi:hypothetical protein